MLCLKKRRTYSFTQGACVVLPRRSKKDNNRYEGSLNIAVTTLPRNNRSKEERPSRMVLTVTEDTPADMLAGSMELLVQLPRDDHLHTQRVTVLRSTPMMDLLVQIATAHKLTASNYTLQAIGERGLVLPHHPNTPIGALDVLQVKLLPKQGTCVPRKTKQVNQPFEATFRLQVHLPRNQLYVSRVSPKMNLGEILDEVCREKNLERSKYELRHPANLEEKLDLSLSLQDYQLQEVTLYAKQAGSLGPTLSTQDIMALQRQEERRRQQTKQSVFGFMFKKPKESSLSTDSLGGRSVSPARSDETARSASPVQPPARPQRKRRPAPKPPADTIPTARHASGDSGGGKDKMVINHSRNSSDSSGYHEASVLSDNPESTARLPETLPRRNKTPGVSDIARKLAQTSQSSKSLGNLTATGETLSRGISSNSLCSTGFRKKRAAPPPPAPRPLSSAISTQALERIVDSEESLTSDMDPSKPSSDIGMPSKAGSDIGCSKANSDICISTQSMHQLNHKPKSEIVTTRESNGNVQTHAVKTNFEACPKSDSVDPKIAKVDTEIVVPVEVAPKVEQARVAAKRVGELAPLPMPRKVNASKVGISEPPKAPKRKIVPLLVSPRTLDMEHNSTNDLSSEYANPDHIIEVSCTSSAKNTISLDEDDLISKEKTHSKLKNDPVFSNENQISQRDQISKTVGDTTIEDAPLSSSKNHKIESNFEPHSNSVESIPVSAEETYFKSKDKFLSEDEFRQEERISGITDDVENHESSNLNQCLNNEGDAGLHFAPAELSASPTKFSLLEPDVIPKKRENISEQDYEIKFDNIDSHIENGNQRDNSFMSSRDDSLNKSVTKQDRATELRTEQTKLPHHQSAFQRPPRARKIISSREIEENVEAAKYINPKDATSGTMAKSSLEKDRESCTVISTIPKCEHLNAMKENYASNGIAKHSTSEDVDESCEKRQGDQREESNNTARNIKRAKVVRSQSKADDFEMDSLKRQRRHFTLLPENIAYALNLNFRARKRSSDIIKKEREQITAGRCINHTRDTDIDRKETHDGLISVAANQDISSETEILLQKVSDTLSSVLPTSSLPVSEPSLPLETNCTSASVQINIAPTFDGSAIKSELVEIKDRSNETYTSCTDFPTESTLSASTPNATTVSTQQDTSDYVSAMSEDLSINDWEYQLPAPPSAFRDSHSPVFDDYDTVTLRSVQAFKEPLAIPVSEPVDATDSSAINVESTKDLLSNPEASLAQEASSEKSIAISEAEVDIERAKNKPASKQTSVVSHKSETKSDLRKEIISELENKIETGALTQAVSKDFDRRNMDSLSAPKIAPVDNTLSNFTITTYTKPRSLDIFEEFEESSDYACNSDERFIKTFATLSRNNVSVPGKYDKKGATRNMRLNGTSHEKKTAIKSNKSDTDNIDCKMEPKIRHQDEPPHRWQSLNAANEKTNIQRSKSYISMFSSIKYQTETQGIDEKKYESRIESEIAGMKKATSVTDLNVDVPRNNEKFSQWRNNILKYQEEPTKEKQLQSLQVLKSILPQLKNAQQTEENVPKEYNSMSLIEKTRCEAGSNENSIKTNSTREFRELDSQCEQLLREESTKRYVYTGPPAINLGSWSERPSVNVQIKMDTDYKLGRNNTNSNKTIVNINGAKNEKDIANCISNINKSNIIKHEVKIDSFANRDPEELARKLITHTTASGYKIPLSNRINVPDSKTHEGRPVVTGVELKKTFVDIPKKTLKNDENEIDSIPVNFRELTRTFDQHMNSKQKRVNVNRHSADYHGARSKEIERITDVNVKQNGHIKLTKVSSQNSPSDFLFKNQHLMHDIPQSSRSKRFTSIVGVNGTGQNLGLQSETSFRCSVNNTLKINPPMPVVKGFKISTTSNTDNNPVSHNGLSTISSFGKEIQPPKPPTMPVITGVTLKSVSARPKSMPVQLDPRDMLLESIRNFGGREKLRSAAKRY